MSIDWGQVLSDAVAAAQGKIGAATPQIKAYLRKVREGHEQALIQLGEARLSGAIDQQTLESEMEDEAKVVEVELLALQVIAKATAQAAADAFIQVVERAIGTALGIVL